MLIRRLLPIFVVLAAALMAAILATRQPKFVLERLATFTLPGGVTMAAAFSPDGRLLATAGELGDLMLRDVVTQQVRWRAKPSDQWIGTLEFAPDGRQLACMGRHLTLHDVDTGAVLWRCRDTGPHTFAWNASGTRFAFCRGDEVLVRDAVAGGDLAQHRFEYPIPALCFDGDETFLCAGDNVGNLWRVPIGAGEPELLRRPRGAGGYETRFLAVARAGGVRFELAWGDALRRGDTELPVPGTPYAFAVNADGSTFVVGNGSGTVRWWTGGGAGVRDLQLGAPIAALASTADGGTLCVSTGDGGIALLRTSGPPVALTGHDDAITDFAISPDGSVVAMRGGHCVLQPVDGSPARQLRDAVQIGAGRRGAEILVASREESRILDGRSGAVVAKARSAGGGAFGEAALGPGNRVVGEFGEFVDLATGARLELPEGVHLPWSRVTTRSPAGTWAVAGGAGLEGESGSLTVTDADGRLQLRVTGGPMPAVAFSTDGERLAYSFSDPDYACGGGRNYRLRVLDGRTLQLVREFRREVGWLRFLDARLALVHDEQGLVVLDTDSGDEVQRLPEVGHGWAQLADDGATLACSDGSEVQVYRLMRR